jgi:tetratricopeptide (TPR) repeat protein
MSALRPGLALWLLLCLAPIAGAQDEISTARALYAAARYEEALGAFDAMKSRGLPTPEAAVAVEQGRALCLMALDRSAEALSAIAALVNLDPFFLPGDEDTAPKLRNAFREGRRRALPDALDRMCSRAKGAYDSKKFVDASIDCSRILALLDDPDVTLDPTRRADMRRMATGFLGLTRSASPLFDASAKNVTAPVPLMTGVQVPDRLRPAESPKTMDVEVVLTAQGTVESAIVRESDSAGLSPQVVRAALDWRYSPALSNSVPVRYRMVVPVVIPPRGI